MTKSFSFALALFVVISSTSAFSQTVSHESTASVFATIKLSLGLVASSKGTGSAVCISSTQMDSYYLTNAHVVGNDRDVTIFRQYPVFNQLKGSVVARGVDDDPDLAIVKVPLGHIRSVQLFLGDLREGDPVAIAGYPSAQYTLAKITGALSPAVHTGTISAIQNRGGVIEYDAQTLPGNSGGPLFDPQTGAVIGLVRAKLVNTTDANLAIGVGRVIAPFLSMHQIAFSRFPARGNGDAIASTSATSDEPPVLKTLPGAGVVAIIYDDSHATGEGTANYIAESASDFSAKIARAFNVRTVVIDASIATKETIAKEARDSSALIGIPYSCSFHSLSSHTNAYGTYSKWTFSLRTAIIDSYATSWASSGSIEKNVNTARGVESLITSSLADLNDQAIEALKKPFERFNDDSVTVNLFRYALPIKNGGRRAFFDLEPSSMGATVQSMATFSPAAEAGLQLGDTVLQLNGTSTVGKSKTELSMMLTAASEAGPYDLTIETADGKSQHIKFEAKPLSWYLDRREAP